MDATWLKGTVRPLGNVTYSVRMAESDERCFSEARTTTSTSQMPLRICAAVTPDTTAFTAIATSWELSPVRRA